MKTFGIICEYNPFHNGHKYHIDIARNELNAEHIVCIMSGSFVQRGEPAIFDKWSRAKMAVLNGADLVLELPFVYACQPAEIFAFGSVKILNDLNILESLCFGSEYGDTKPLYELANILKNEPENYKVLLKNYLNEGYTYPKAVSLSLTKFLNSIQQTDISNIINSPNNLLGIEYIKALLLLNSNIQPIAIKRIIAEYNETEIKQSIASATAIRKEMFNAGLSKKIKLSTPDSCSNIIKNILDTGREPMFLNNYSDIILYKLRTMKADELQDYLNIKEGIENRLLKYAASATSCEELIEKIKTKRYTRTFIQRLLCHILIGLKEKDIKIFKKVDCPSYARVLAFNDKGKYLLKKIKENENYPIITKVANFKTNDEILNKIFEYDILSTNIYNLGYNNKAFKLSGEDFYNSPIHI